MRRSWLSRAMGALRPILVRAEADERGAVAIIFALALIPVIGVAGAALDYSRAATAQTFLSSAADAAAVSMVNSSGMDQSTTNAQAEALKIFNAQAASVRFATNVAATMSISESATIRTATVSFTADVPTTLMGLLGVTKVPIGGQVSSTGAPPIYMDFYLLLDNTPSMGVAATTADIAKMESETVKAGKTKCAFACHDLSDSNDNYKLAKNKGITTRIDVVRSASQELMDTATATATVSGQYRAAVYTFGSSCTSTGANRIASLSSNLASVRSSAGAIDLMTIPQQNYNYDQCTDMDGTLAGMNLAIPLPGNGSSAATPMKVLFFVSDGVADSYNPLGCSKTTTSGRCQEPIDVATCTAIKNRGIKIAVLYTTYLPLPSDSWYVKWISPFASSIGPTMASCASPGLYTEVSPSQGISEALTKLFQTAVSTARITR